MKNKHNLLHGDTANDGVGDKLSNFICSYAEQITTMNFFTCFNQICFICVIVSNGPPWILFILYAFKHLDMYSHDADSQERKEEQEPFGCKSTCVLCSVYLNLPELNSVIQNMN